MLEGLIHWLTETILRLGYPGIALLMAVESSVFPLPSEIVMPPAGYLAAQGRMSVWLAVLAGIIGSVLGALFNYYLAVALGRPLLHKYHRYLLVKESSLDRAEAFFRRHGEISTFLGRLVPVVRHLISLPAGIARMRLDHFAFFTAAGAGIWCVILTFIGWYVGRNAHLVSDLDALIDSPEIRRYSTVAGLVLIPVVAIVIAAYAAVRRRTRPSDTPSSGPERAGES